MSTASETVDEVEEAAALRPSLVLRLKRLLVAPLLLLRRLRKPAQAEEAMADDASPARGRDRGRGRDEEAEEAEAVPAGPPRWRRALPYAIVFALGAAAAGGTVSWLAAQVIARQSAQIDTQEADIARLKGVLAGYDKMMLQNRKKLEVEQGRRAEAENRLAMAQADLLGQPPAAAGRSGGAPGASRNAAGSGKMADCTLRPGSAGATLKDCLADFNRQ